MSDGIRIQLKKAHDTVMGGVEPCEGGNGRWCKYNPGTYTYTYFPAAYWEEIPPTTVAENVTGECDFVNGIVWWHDGQGQSWQITNLVLWAIEKGFSLEMVEAYDFTDAGKYVCVPPVGRDEIVEIELEHILWVLKNYKQSFIRITRTTEQGT